MNEENYNEENYSEIIEFEDDEGNVEEMEIVDEFSHEDNRYIVLRSSIIDSISFEDISPQLYLIVEDEDTELFELVEGKKLRETLLDILEERLMKRI